MVTTTSHHHVILKGRVQVRYGGVWVDSEVCNSPSLALTVQQDIEYRQGVAARIVWILVAGDR